MSSVATAEKTCSKCKTVKPVSEYRPRKNYSFGVSCRCIECDRLVNKETYLRHAEAYRKRNYEYSKTHRTERNKYNTAWQKQNKDKVALYQKRAYEKNPLRLRNNRLKSEYGISIDEYRQMHAAQSGVCSICQSVCFSGTLSVDHDHETGKVRGLLCRKCNTAIGMLGDDIKLVQRAVNYLKSFYG